MTALKKSPARVLANGSAKPALPMPFPTPIQPFSIEKVKELVAELELPFSPSVVEWRVMNTNEDGSRGQIMPYADQRAYTDRLNELFTPAGWTRKYTVNTSPNFERSEDGKVVAKVFVTCDLTIHGIGSHSATGEEWADDDNAGTSAEAQAFKRACSCFGLGRYLYYFGGIWVDLDDRQRPRDMPQLHGWATPEGWRKGLRPPQREDAGAAKPGSERPLKNNRSFSSKKKELIQQIETLADPVGKTLYRGLLKKVARAWKPGDIQDTGVLKKVLISMQVAERGLCRLEVARSKIAPEAMESILDSLKLKSVQQVDNLEILDRLVSAAEERAAQVEAT